MKKAAILLALVAGAVMAQPVVVGQSPPVSIDDDFVTGSLILLVRPEGPSFILVVEWLPEHLGRDDDELARRASLGLHEALAQARWCMRGYELGRQGLTGEGEFTVAGTCRL